MDIKDIARPLDGAGISAFLQSLPVRPWLLGLGEARHFVGELGDVRNEIFRHLVEHEGYRSLAVESDCLSGMIVDEYVRTGAGDLDEVMSSGFSHNFGGAPGNRELVRWMREYNQEHEDKLRFFGFDGPLEYWAASPREALTALHDLLDGPLGCTRETLDALLGPDERWSNPATVMDPYQSIGQSADAQRLRVIADDLLALLDTQLPRLTAADRERAELYGRTATGLLRYHHWMADTSPARISRLSGLRGAMMAANLQAVAAHGPALVFTHNLHLQRAESVMSLGDHEVRMWSAGAITAARLGNRFAYLATAFGTVGDDVPPADTVEGILSGLPWDNALIDTRGLATLAGGATPRVSTDFAYFPLDPAHPGAIDGLVFLKQVLDVRAPA
ncbi:erythromycin esterase [Actinoplanes cyaneus]|uniref:Erythromycin esterase n=1 Tax=Actinoplanes cyaneus TaxID=52696 RepID=A0A919IML0_9ACTN|nr:erythromycin esterase family protein [Actinoplanes cyaneus]MCW2139890.1 Erythromycin esterase homolog [Actinoplanes cyaneus]GID67816.1 erythromycin esterase [Actinoplanes cyaneus]